MKLHETIPYSLKQLLRTPMKIVLYFVLPLLVAAFLCLGLNLYQYASSNLNAVYTAFDVTALPSFRGNLNTYGELCEDLADPEYAGYFLCEAENYDLTPLTQLEGVMDYDIRNQFGAYVSNASAKLFSVNASWAGNAYGNATVICFTLATSQETVIPKREGKVLGQANIPVYVKWAAARVSDSPESVVQTLTIRNGYEREFVLEPEKEYVAILGEMHNTAYDMYHLPQIFSSIPAASM